MPAAARPNTAGARQMSQPLEPHMVEPYRTNRRFAVAKLALGLSNLIFSAAALGFITTGFTSGRFFMWLWIDHIYLSLAVTSIMWHLAEHITLAIRREWRSIRPGAHVGMHLILCVLAVLVVTFYGLELAYELYYSSINETCWAPRGGPCDFRSFPSQDAANSYFGKMKALTAFSVMMLVLHFTLFVMACIETDRKTEHEIIYLAAAPGLADSRMYYTPVAQPPQSNEGTGLTTETPHHDQEGIAASR